MVQEPTGSLQIFYMPERTNTKPLEAQDFHILGAMRIDGFRLGAIDFMNQISPSPWLPLEGVLRGSASGQGQVQYKAGSGINLYKPYPVQTISNSILGDLLAENEEGYLSAQESIYKDASDTPAFPATDDTIVVSKDGQVGVLYRDGQVLIDFGKFEDLVPSWNQQLWAKQDGPWGLIDLSDAKEKLSLPSAEESGTSNGDVSASIVRDDQSAKDSSGNVCVPMYMEMAVLEGGNPAIMEAVNHQLLSESVSGFLRDLFISQEEIDLAAGNPLFLFKKATSAESMELSSDLVSVRFFDYAILGGTTALVESFRGATFDLQMGHHLTLSNLFHRSGPELQSYMADQCVSCIRQNSDLPWSPYAEDTVRDISFENDDTGSFYVKGNAVYLLFPKYMLGAGQWERWKSLFPCRRAPRRRYRPGRRSGAAQPEHGGVSEPFFSPRSSSACCRFPYEDGRFFGICSQYFF